MPIRTDLSRSTRPLLAAVLLACAGVGAAPGQEMLAGRAPVPDRATLIEAAEAALPRTALRELVE